VVSAASRVGLPRSRLPEVRAPWEAGSSELSLPAKSMRPFEGSVRQVGDHSCGNSSPRAPAPACGVYDADVNPELEPNVPSERRRANPTDKPTPERTADALSSMSLEEIEAEIARRRSFGVESLLARRKDLEEDLQAIVAEIAALESDAPLRAIETRLRAMAGKAITEQPPKLDAPRAPEPASPPPKVWTPPARPVAPTMPAESGQPARPTPFVKPPTVVPPVINVVPPVYKAAPIDRVVGDARPHPKAPPMVEPVPAKGAPPRVEVDPGARPQSLGRVVLETIAESNDVAISLRDITEAVRSKLQRERPDLERAVAQVIGDLRGKGAIEATGFEIYVATEAGRRRLRE